MTTLLYFFASQLVVSFFFRREETPHHSFMFSLENIDVTCGCLCEEVNGFLQNYPAARLAMLRIYLCNQFEQRELAQKIFFSF